MSKSFNGWAIKNKWGSILLWTVGETKKEVIGKTGGLPSYQKRWRDKGHKAIKIKVIEG